MKDQAARIAAREYATDAHSEDHEVAHANAYRPRLERAIRRAIASAVRDERERCVGIILESDTPGTPGKYERQYMLEANVEKINGGKR